LGISKAQSTPTESSLALIGAQVTTSESKTKSCINFLMRCPMNDDSWPEEMTLADKFATIIAAHRIFKDYEGDHHDRNLWMLFDDIVQEESDG